MTYIIIAKELVNKVISLFVDLVVLTLLQLLDLGQAVDLFNVDTGLFKLTDLFSSLLKKEYV